MLSFTIIQFQTTHNQIVYSLLHVHLFVSRFLYVLRWKCCSIAIEYIQCYTSTYWIDRLLRYFVSFFLNGAIINKLHYALNGFNSKSSPQHQHHTHYLLSISFHFSHNFFKHYSYWQVISQLIRLLFFFLWSRKLHWTPTNGNQFNKEHCIKLSVQVFGWLKFHINGVDEYSKNQIVIENASFH